MSNEGESKNFIERIIDEDLAEDNLENDNDSYKE